MENEIPRAKAGFKCPQYKQDVSEVCHTCAWWTGLKWKLDDGSWDSKWNCAIVNIALGQVDVTRESARTRAETKAMREEVVKRAVSPPAWAVKEIVRDALEGEAQESLALGMPRQRLIGSG